MSRPSPAKVRIVLARIRKIEHWINLSEHQILEGDTELGAIGNDETDSKFRAGLLCALSWVAGEYDENHMPNGLRALVQHTNKRVFMELLKENEEHWERDVRY
jgi:hypothetical protein